MCVYGYMFKTKFSANFSLNNQNNKKIPKYSMYYIGTWELWETSFTVRPVHQPTYYMN